MILIEKSQLGNFNYTHDITLHYARLESVDFHQICSFPYDILVLVTGGNEDNANYINCKESGQRMSLTPNHYYFVPAGLHAEYKLTPSVQYMTFHVGFEIYPGIELFDGAAQCLTAHAPEFIKNVRSIFDDPNDHRAICRLKHEFFSFAVQHWPEHFNARALNLAQHMDLLNYIVKNCSAALTVKALAKREGIAPEAFSRKFHMNIGEPPKTFIKKMLLSKILALLASPNHLRVKEIAEKLNFSSEFYLSRFIKKLTGLSPSEYRSRFQ